MKLGTDAPAPEMVTRPAPLEKGEALVCLHEIFERQADDHPERKALECADRVWTYGALEVEANRLAWHLRSLGAGPGRFIGISLERSEWQIITLLAVLKAGAAYVPLDTSLPDDRLRYIAATAKLAAIVTQSASADRLSSLCGGEQISIEDHKGRASAFSHARLSREEIGLRGTDPCYVLFTSGTTGRPKGVVTEHRNVVRFIRAFNQVCCTAEADRVFQGFSLGFDGSVEEIWMAFSNGATLVCGDSNTPRFGPELAAFLRDRAITFFSTVPTLLSTLPTDMPSLRQLVVSGEACPPDLANRWSQRVSRMLNVYGPTEATVNTTAAVLRPGRPITIGWPLRGYEIHVLNEKLEPVPPGQRGELFIGGPTLARGYLNEPELTAQSFVECASPVPGEPLRLYRTGDLVRQKEDGELEFLGRIDNQVKIRGHRVELAEVEAVLLENPAVAAAAVRVYDHAGVQGLAGYVLLAAGADCIDRTKLHRTLRDRLPHYMIPTHLDVLREFPTLASGKVDRRKLPEPEHALAEEDDAPTGQMTELESVVAAVWARLCRVPKVGPDQDFFTDLGGHSLLAARLVTTLRREFRCQVAIRDIYANPTVRRLVGFIASNAAPVLEEESGGQPAAGDKAAGRIPRRRWLSNVVQVLYLLSIVPLLALPSIYLITLTVDALHFRASVVELAVTALVVALATWMILIVVAILAKWVLVGRYRPGCYPLWGSYYVRWWVVSRLQHLCRLSAFDGTPLAPLLWRAMGARVGARCVLNAGLVYAWDCIRIGDDVSIGHDTHLPGLRVESGCLIVGRVEIGSRCFIGCHSALGLNVSMGDDSRLDDQSMLPDDSTVPTAASYRGSPARGGEVAVPEGAPVRFSRLRMVAFCAAQIVCGLVVALLMLLPLAASAWLGAILFLHYPIGIFLGCFALLVPAAIFGFALWSALCKRLVRPPPQPGVFQVYSLAYLRHWLTGHVVMQIVQSAGLTVFTTLYLPPWMRLLGARLGRQTEMSTVWRLDPDMVSAGDGVFFADGCMMAGVRTHIGRFELARSHIGDRSFIGNSAIVSAGVNVGRQSLLGVLSAPPHPRDAIPDNTDWLGSPAFLLPNRQRVTAFDERQTFSPSWGLYAQRALIDGLRVVLPGYVLGAIGVLALLVVPAAYARNGVWGAYTAIPLLAWPSIVLVLGAVIGAKWCLMGRFRPVVVPLWHRYVWWNELINGLYESLMAPLVANFFGTPFAGVLLRTLGCRIGRYCYIETNLFSEFDLVEIGDHVALNAGAVLQNHLFEDRVMKSGPLKIGYGCTIGNMGIVLYDAIMERGSTLSPMSLLMKGETLPEGCRGQGIPLVQVV